MVYMNQPMRIGAIEPEDSGKITGIDPISAGWSYVGFEVYRILQNKTLEQETGKREVCCVVLEGSIEVKQDNSFWARIGKRSSVFKGCPEAFYLPPSTRFTVQVLTPHAEIALCWAPAKHGAEPRLITEDKIKELIRGTGNTRRIIRNILMEDQPAEALLVTEAITPGGNWSSYPPHKHDSDNPPQETYLEETYYYRLDKPNGFALHAIYTHDGSTDVVYRVRDRDLVTVPRGFHPVSTLPGYELYYLNVMAGPTRKWLVSIDQEFSWQTKDAFTSVEAVATADPQDLSVS